MRPIYWYHCRVLSRNCLSPEILNLSSILPMSKIGIEYLYVRVTRIQSRTYHNTAKISENCNRDRSDT